MDLRLSVAARERAFSKKMRRVYPKFEELREAFGKLMLRDPIDEAILVGITDDKPDGYFAVVPNRDGYYQVIAGCNPAATDDEIARRVFEALRQAMRECPFSKPDHDALELLFAQYEPRFP